MPKLRLTREIGFNRQGTEISLHQDFYVGAHCGVSPFFFILCMVLRVYFRN